MKKTISTMFGFTIITIVAVVLFGGVLTYQYFSQQDQSGSVQIVYNKPGVNAYINNRYGFKISFPDSWKNYSVTESSWSGWKVDGSGASGDYTGVEFIFKNPKTTAKQQWQDVPIMVFTKDEWGLVREEKIAVSAAPVGPAKVGENSKYVFATPPRWYGFTNAMGWQEAVDIVKTFKTF